MNFDRIPQDLKEHMYWCVWKYDQRGGKRTKVPYNPRTGHKTRTNPPDTFAPFTDALAAYQRGGYDGLGIGVFGDIGAVDIDSCFNPIHGPDQRAQSIIASMNSYAEISPSGTGLRIIFRAPGFEFDRERHYIKRGGLEVYIAGCTSRFVTITGNAYNDLTISERSSEISAVLGAHMVRPTAKKTSTALPPSSVLTDEQVLVKAPTSAHGERFTRLWSGDTSEHANDASAADLALCNILAFYCGGDAEQMDRLFRQSGLYREKWEREDYRNATIERAVNDCTAFYGQGSTAEEDFAAATSAKKLKVKPMSAIRAKRAEYLLAPYIPKGKLIILAGVSGGTKTWAALKLATIVSNGAPFITDDMVTPCRTPAIVVYQTRENDYETDIRPRLDILGANLDNILVIDEQDTDGKGFPLSLIDGRIEDVVKDYKAALLIFDPIQSYIGAELDFHKANEVRPVLDRLASICARYGCSIILISHMSKDTTRSALDRILGSSDLRNAARSILIVGVHPDKEDHRVLVHAKNNLGLNGKSIEYHLDMENAGVVFDGFCNFDEDEVIHGKRKEGHGKDAVALDDAVRMLHELLSISGHAALEDVHLMAGDAGIGQRTLYNARKKLNLTTRQFGKPPARKTFWILPGTDETAIKQEAL